MLIRTNLHCLAYPGRCRVCVTAPIKDLELIDSNTDSLLKVLKLPEGEEAFRAFLGTIVSLRSRC